MDARAQVQRVSDEAKAVRADVDALAQKVEDSRSEAENARNELDVEIDRLTKERKPVDADALMAVALSPIGDSKAFHDAKTMAQNFAAGLADWHSFVKSLATPRGLAVVGLVIAAPVATWVVSSFDSLLTAATEILAAAAGSITHVMTFIRDRRNEFEAKLVELEAEEERRLKEKKKTRSKRKRSRSKRPGAPGSLHCAQLLSSSEVRSLSAKRERRKRSALSRHARRSSRQRPRNAPRRRRLWSNWRLD